MPAATEDSKWAPVSPLEDGIERSKTRFRQVGENMLLRN